jgi:dipeptidyl aminopeptidase/acylaminoacyl peptidase
MKRILFGFALIAAPLSAQQPSAFDFSIKNIMRGPELYGRAPSNTRWSADSKWIYFTWLEPGHSYRDQPTLFRVRAIPGAKPERVSIPAQDSTGATFLLEALSHDKRSFASSYGGDIYLTNLATGSARRLTQTVGAERNPQFGIGDRAIYFTRDNNIYSIDVSNGFLRQLSDIRSGPAPVDSVTPAGQRGALAKAQRELFGSVRDLLLADSIAKAERTLRSSLTLKPVYLNRGESVDEMSVSPTGRNALISTTTAADAARRTRIPSFITRSGYEEEIPGRTNVGDVGARSRVGLVDLAGGTVKWLKISADSSSAALLTGNDADATPGVTFLGWNDSGDRAAFFSHSTDNKVQSLYTIDVTGKMKALDTLRDSAWVGGPCFACGGWYDNGRRLWYVSERDGFSHLYTTTPDGTDTKQLTSGRWEVRDVALSPDEQTFYLTTNEPSPFDQHFFRMSVNGGGRQRITTKPGKHAGVVSPDGKLVADVYSYVNRPPELFVMANRAGSEESQLTTSPSAEWFSFNWIAPEIVMIPASDGVQVPAHIYRPADMGAKPNGGAVIFVHGAGYLHNVGHFWSEYPREYQFNQYLAAHGYVVLDLDYRGSDGYGRDWRTAIYRHMGGRDLQDQVDASKYLNPNYKIDPERVGIYGGSYGGFITLMALFTEPKHFGAGAAIRSVTDWAHYNNGYTSNILNLPQSDTLAYRQSSPIYFAEGLEDPLLMLHGMIDDNVEYIDIVRLEQRLIELGKTNWWLASYPVERHAFVRPDSWTDEYNRIFNLFERFLPDGAPRK